MMPLDFISMIKRGQNPQQLILSFLEQRAGENNPLAANILEMAKENNTQAIEQFARNYLQSQGKDFDTEFNSFRQKFGL